MDLAKEFGIVMQGRAAIWHGKMLPIDGHVKKKKKRPWLTVKVYVKHKVQW